MSRITTSPSTQPEPDLPGDLGPAIAKAFKPKGAKWRTVGGIARTSNVPARAVRKYIYDHRDLFVAAPVAPAGKKLYAVKAGPKIWRVQSSKGAAG